MAPNKPDTDRKTIKLSKTAIKCLDELAERGLHGNDSAKVAQSFVEEGIRKAIKEGFIRLPENEEKEEKKD